jgi:hypothetical protein
MLVMCHDDDCGELLDKDGQCPTCKFHPDMQSTSFIDRGTRFLREDLANGKTFLGEGRKPVWEPSQLDQEIEEVLCKRCDKPYPLIFGEDTPTQGNGCDVGVHYTKSGKWILVGHYGSKYDLTLFEFVKEPEESLKYANPICDNCVDSLKSNGTIKYIREVGMNELMDNDLGIIYEPKA